MFQEISILITSYKTGEALRSELLQIFAKAVLKENVFQHVFKYATPSVCIFVKMVLLHRSYILAFEGVICCHY
jgi:hypothetical protein